MNEGQRNKLRYRNHRAPPEQFLQRHPLAEIAIQQEGRDERDREDALVVRVDIVCRVQPVGEVELQRRIRTWRKVPQKAETAMTAVSAAAMTNVWLGGRCREMKPDASAPASTGNELTTFHSTANRPDISFSGPTSAISP